MKKRKRTAWSRRIERNILACYYRASVDDRAEGLYWYETAHNDAKTLSERHDVTLEQAVGVIAALSPGRQWGLNLLDEDQLIAAYVAGKRLPGVGSYGRRNIVKARKILDGESPMDVLPVTGPKTRAFYTLILDPTDATTVCVDRHAKAVAVNRLGSDIDGSNVVHVSEYEFYAWHYRAIAERLGLLSHQMQATTWVCWRRLHGNLNQLDLIPF